mgnify:CR=1 FL=1
MYRSDHGKETDCYPEPVPGPWDVWPDPHMVDRDLASIGQIQSQTQVHNQDKELRVPG